MINWIKLAKALMIIGAIAIIAPPLYCAFKADPLTACMGTGLILGIIGGLIFLIHFDDQL